MHDEQFKYMEPGEDFEEETGKLEISYIWQRQSEVSGSRICRTFKDRCYDIKTKFIGGYQPKEFCAILN